MLIKKINDIAKEPVNMECSKNAFRQLPIGKADNTPNFSFRVFTLEPGGHTPYHVHQSEHVNYFISGKGAIKDEEGLMHEVGAGDFSLILPQEKHQYLNTSDSEDLVFICAVMKEYE